MNEWIGEIVLLIFIIGREFQNNKAKNSKVDDHEKELKTMENKLHTLTNNFNAFKQTNEVKTSIVLMLLFQVCKAQGIDTDMAQFILNTDTPDGLKSEYHKK